MFQIGRISHALQHVTAALVVALALTLGLTSIGAANVAAAGDKTLVGKTSAGKVLSKVVGSTAAGDAVTGSFTPVKFVKKGGTVFAKGFLEGVITDPAGKKTLFSGIERIPVKKINGQPVTSARALNQQVTCDILHLVLGPLDLDLLGLVIHLDRVVLDIVAVTGAGNLLGNLLCAVVGLLDGGLGGLLGQLAALLNQILDMLNMGV